MQKSIACNTAPNDEEFCFSHTIKKTTHHGWGEEENYPYSDCYLIEIDI